jgi:hypothetical protein
MTAKVFFVELADAQKSRVLAQFQDARPGGRYLYETVAPGLDLCGQPLRRWPVSHRANERPEQYARRLTRVRLRRSELREIGGLYARLDAERAIEGLPAAERAPWSPADILEWQDLTARERYLDLKNYARASDRIAGTQAGALQAAA